MNTEELLANWLKDYAKTLSLQKRVTHIRLAAPRFQTRNYFARYKVETAELDGTGQNPTNINCFVVEVSETDQTARVEAATACDSINDL